MEKRTDRKWEKTTNKRKRTRKGRKERRKEKIQWVTHEIKDRTNRLLAPDRFTDCWTAPLLVSRVILTGLWRALAKKAGVNARRECAGFETSVKEKGRGVHRGNSGTFGMPQTQDLQIGRHAAQVLDVEAEQPGAHHVTESPEGR